MINLILNARYFIIDEDLNGLLTLFKLVLIVVGIII